MQGAPLAKALPDEISAKGIVRFVVCFLKERT
jgi:hypothetical protein